jgi:ABC-type antimicrobial peptide transport system permease subunit
MGGAVAAIRQAFTAERRRRWASWLALVLLVALVGGAVLSGVSAAKRTESAFPDFIHRYGSDVAIFASGGVPSGSQLPGAHARLISTYAAAVGGNVRIGPTFIPSSDMTVFVLPRHGAGKTVKLLSGQLPTRPGQALAGFSLAQQAGLHIGSVVRVPMYSTNQAQAIFVDAGSPPPKGPTESFRIVGFEASMLDFPTSTPSYSIYTDHAFVHQAAHQVLWATIGFYRLADGAAGVPRFSYDVNHLTIDSVVYPLTLDSGTAAIENTIHPQVVGWWLFALIAAVAGLALVGQALARQSLVERESFPTLSALGFRPGQLFGLGLARALLVGLAGGIGAVLLTFLVSPLTPVGEARAAEPVQGFVADPLLFCIGAVGIAVVVLLLAAYPSWRAAQARSVGRSVADPIPHASLVASAAARTGAPPAMLIGIRHAIERGRGRSSVPVATALVGTIAAVTALSATAVFGFSLTHLLDTPTLYGQNWQVDLGGFNASQDQAVASAAVHLPGVKDVSYGVSNKQITVNGDASTNIMMIKSAKGPILLSAVGGRVPTSLGEIGLGTETMAQAHTGIGDVATIAFIAPNGKTIVSRLRVVGSLVFPPVVNQGGGLGDGAMIYFPTVFSILCGTTAASSQCVRSLEQRIDAPTFMNWGMAIATTHDAAGQRAAATLEREFPTHLDVITVPVNLVNFGQAVNFPLLLGLMLAIFGAATLVHLLLVSVSRRRRELALLKVLGFLRGQAAAAVCWQAATVAVVGLVVGVPLGVAVGHLVWEAFAGNVGIVSVTVVPLAALLELTAVVLVGSTVIAAVPALIASRVRPAPALREG